MADTSLAATGNSTVLITVTDSNSAAVVTAAIAALLQFTLAKLLATLSATRPYGNPRTGEKPALTQDISFIRGADIHTYRASVPAAKVTRKTRWRNKAPFDCILEAEKPHPDRNGAPSCEFERLRVSEVWFDDAPDSWVLCHCGDTRYSEDDVLGDMGRMPVGVRQYVRNFIVFEGWGAGTVNSGADVILWGEGPHLYNHESGHTVDLGSRISDTPAFRRTFAKDTCWLSQYSKSSGERTDMVYQHEIWAEAFTFDMWRRQRGGNWPSHFNPSCASNVLGFVRKTVDPIVKEGYNKNYRVPPDNVVTWTNTKKRGKPILHRKAALLDGDLRVCSKPSTQKPSD